jgi:hypothetical protein
MVTATPILKIAFNFYHKKLFLILMYNIGDFINIRNKDKFHFLK